MKQAGYRCSAILVSHLLMFILVGPQALAAAGTETYTYDALGRLTSVAYANQTTVNYSYDAAGNRLQVQSVDSSPPTAPGAPTYTAITATSATANWTAATDSIGIASYEFQVNSGVWTNIGNHLNVEISGLTTGVTYTVSVHAKDSFGTAGPASSSSLTTLDTIAPSAPGTPAFTSISGTTATANWSAATDNVAVTSYEYQLNGTTGTWLGVGTSLSAALSGLVPVTSYTVYVHAKDAAGNTGPASSNSFTTLDTIPPTTPGPPTYTNVTATGATMNWTAATDNVGVASYEYQINSTAGTWTNVGNVLGSSLGGLSPATTYIVYLRARDAAGNPGSPSNSSLTTQSQVSDTLPWASGSTLSFCGGQFANTNATYTFTVSGGSEVVTISPSNTAFTVTNTGWTSGATLAAGTYSTKITATFAVTGFTPLTITFSGTGHSSTASVHTYQKATCP